MPDSQRLGTSKPAQYKTKYLIRQIVAKVHSARPDEPTPSHPAQLYVTEVTEQFEKLQVVLKPAQVLVPINEFTSQFSGSVGGLTLPERLTTWTPLCRLVDQFKTLAQRRRRQLAQILVIDDDPYHAKELADVLERHQHSVVISEPRRILPPLLINDKKNFDVLVLSLPANFGEGLRILSAIRECRSLKKPAVICLARVYQGTRLRLEVERKGGCLIYEN
jgi:CheY-like chemotaxis protein